ncbi:hypothetical protein [Micromonospora aurantiaca (nom. illeg.)]|uniref:hypothetical protein n=1 Tax=Micromonospora aurantiaca (nom. illeg.) TaxID=47850 RepID=UPI000827FFC4|nr:hypothetical protein [Micromonospora aurantiaca]SCL43350.1 hypothetical protein GA0070615_6414 [Micromonospora aurantiaca]
MDAEELVQVDQRLRELCLGRGLGWVVSDVDELIRQGQHVAGRREYFEEWATDRFGRYPARIDPGKRPATASLRETPFSAPERTLLLIDAMLAVFAQLPALQAETLEALRDGRNGLAPPVNTITLTSGGESPPVPIDGFNREAMARVAESLQRLRAAVIEQ